MLARHHHETITQYHNRLKAERSRTEAHLKGKFLWISAALVPARDNLGCPIPWQHLHSV